MTAEPERNSEVKGTFEPWNYALIRFVEGIQGSPQPVEFSRYRRNINGLQGIAEQSAAIPRKNRFADFFFKIQRIVFIWNGKTPLMMSGDFWWAIRDSNPGPTGYEPGALTN